MINMDVSSERYHIGKNNKANNRLRKELILKLLWWFVLFSLFSEIIYAKVPLQHGSNYSSEKNLDITQYYVSEKLDGVRGYWNGEVLLTRQGNPIHAPNWFIEGLGDIALDGELWIDRNQFEKVSGIIRKNQPNDDWRLVKFMVFDLPKHKGTFNERILAMRIHIDALNRPWIQKIPQKRFQTIEAMGNYHQTIQSKQGEGLMLHHQDAYYQSGRVDHLLKVKVLHDQEGRVIAHFEGKGKYQGMMGSLLIELENGIRFKLGSGFTDEERRNPPAIGANITFQYNGYTRNGIPRFARFLRIRHDD